MKADAAMTATSAGILKLKNASRGLNVPLDELVSFYRQDLADISAMTELQTYNFIENYLNNYRLNGRPIVALCAKVEPVNIETAPPAQALTVLDSLPLLHEDRLFIDARLKELRLNSADRQTAINEYVRIWQEGAAAMPTEHREDNAGRFAANSWLRELSHTVARALKGL